MTHEPYFRYLARFFFAPGYDRDDMLQEARVAAWLAPGHERTAAWRALCEIVRRETQRRPQCFPLLDEDLVGGDLTVDMVLIRERLAELVRKIETLTAAEQRALLYVVNGHAYQENGCRDKRIDNALQRARRKLAA